MESTWIQRFSHVRIARGISAALVAFIWIATPATQAAPPRGITQLMLAVDLSGSMQGERLSVAKTSLSTLVANIDPSISIGLVSFNGTASLVQIPTNDRILINRQIMGFSAAGKTALFDALALSIRNLNSPTKSAVVLLCDGEDNSSIQRREDVIALAKASGVTINVVAIRPSQVQRDVLRSMTDATGGLLVAAENLGDLEKGLAAFTTPPLEPQPERTFEPEGVSNTLIPPILSAVAVLALMVSWRLRDLQKLRARINEYLKPRATNPLRRSWKGAKEMGRRIAPLWYRYESNLAKRLDDAGIQQTVREWVTRQALAGAVGFVLFLLISRSLPITLLLTVVGTWQWSRLVLRKAREGMALRFEGELHSALLVAASSLRSGLSLVQAIDAIAREGNGEVARQFRRAVGEVQMGSTMEDALTRVADRVQSEDLHWVVATLAIQREVGGSLSNIIVSTADMIGERFALRREIRTLSAEGRLSARVLVMMPVLVMMLFLLTRRDYIDVLWTTPLGFFCLITAGILEAFGAYWIKQMVKVKV